MIFVWLIVYVLIGAFLLGLSLKLFTEPEVRAICEMIGLDEIFESYGDNFIGLCFFYALLWPLAIGIVVFVFPFAIVKYLYDNKWSKENEDDNKESLDI